MFSNFDEESRKILVLAKKQMMETNPPYVGSEHLLLAILHSSNTISDRLRKLGLTYDKFKQEIINIIGIGTNDKEVFLYTPLLKRVIENAIIDSKENNNNEVTINHLFSSLLEEGEGVAIRIMLGMNINLENVYNEFAYKLLVPKTKNGKKLLLEELGVDLTLRARNKELDPVIGREKEVARVIEILSRRTKNNPLLIGPAGVGKTAIVEQLAYLISISDVPLSLRNKRIISLDMATTVAGTKYRGEFEERIKKILKEIEDNDDIILFIDEIHTIVGAGGAEGAIDASNIFKPALARGKIKVIGATTTEEYKKFIEEDKALSRRFQTVMIDVPNKENVHNILMGLKPVYESFHSVSISSNIINLIIDLSEKYIHNRNQPDKAIDIMDEVCAYVSLKENKSVKKYNGLNKELQSVKTLKDKCITENDFKTTLLYREQETSITDKINNLELNIKKTKMKNVTKDDVAYVLNMKTGIPIYELLNDNIKIIKGIEQTIKNKIIGQDKAVKEVIDIIKKVKLGFKDDNKCYSLLFCGPSGVGKTELATLFGKVMVDNNVIRLDMSEYSDASAVSKIVGSAPGYVGYSDNKNVLEEVRSKPFSVIILDELEKASNQVLNLFYQILDNGKIKNSKVEYVFFDNTVIIMTSNIGYDEDSIGFNKQDIHESKITDNFSIPFINRVDSIIYFNSLTEDNIRTIINNKIVILKDKYKNKGVKVKITHNVVDEMIVLSNYTSYGARKIDKILKDKVEDIIVDNILNNNYNITISTINNQYQGVL